MNTSPKKQIPSSKSSILILSMVIGWLASPQLVMAHSDHDHASELSTGQGSMVFTWDQELTAKFPEAAKRHEAGMHGGFNEDVDTGIVYTGIPGYGFCSISADLTSWTLLGDDKRLKDNIHGLVVYKHKGKKYVALAQHSRILIVDLLGKVIQDISKPTGTKFNFAAANKWYSTGKNHFNCTDVTYLNGK